MHPSLRKLLLQGTAAILFQVALAALILSFDLPVYLIAACFLLGVPLGLYVGRAVPGLAFPAMCILALSGAAPVFVVDTPFWGSVVKLRLADDIPAHAGIAGCEAQNWRIDTSRTYEEVLTAGRGKRRYAIRRFAPLVGEGWTPVHPVEIWVIGEIRDSGRITARHPQFWPVSGGDFARLVGNDREGAEFGAMRAAKALGLTTAPSPLVVLNVRSIPAAQVQQFIDLGKIVLTAGAILLLLVVLAEFWLRRGGAVRLLRR